MTQDQDQKLLLDEVEAFCRRHGLSDTRFGALSPVNDTHLVDRMRRGMLRPLYRPPRHKVTNRSPANRADRQGPQRHNTLSC